MTTVMPGTLLGPGALVAGRYRLDALIGEGTRKLVHLAEDTFLDRVVAVLSLKPGHDGPIDRARLRREAAVTARLGDHPAVVAVHDLVEEGGMPYVIAQHLEGGALADRIQDGPLPVAEALSVARDVASALQHAHSRGVVHRDVKPANVWLTSRGSAVLGDFGLAARLDDAQVPALQGTAEWVAPEQAIGAPPDPRSDLYSLGALLYALLCGRPPHVADGVVGLLEQVLRVVPEPPSALRPDVPPGLDALVRALLAKDPQDRPAAAHDVVVGLSLVQMEVRPGGGAAAAKNDFVGRDDELAFLSRGLYDAGRGGAPLTVVSGDAGVGKTRMVLELAGRARADGWQVLAGRCYEGDGAPPFWPWTQVLRAALREHGVERLQRLAGPAAALLVHVLPELAEGGSEPTPLDDDLGRFRLFDAVAHLLRSLSTVRPVLVVVDDLHWADPASHALASFLARHLDDSPVALIACQRPDGDAGRSLPTGTRRLELGGLPREQTARFLELSTGVTPDEHLLDELQARTDGNPFFLGELVRLLSAEQRLDQEGGLVPSEEVLPHGVRDVLQRRLRLVSAQCAGVLGAAAVQGREVSLEVLQLVTGAGSEGLLGLLEEATQARLLSALPGIPVRYRFAHALVQEFLYDGLPPAQRMDLHARTGEALRQVHAAALDSHAAALAHHFVRAAAAGDPAQALFWSVRAGRAAEAASAHEEAVAHLSRALAVLEASSVPAEGELDRGALLLALGEAQCRAGDTTAGRASFQRAADEGLLRGDAELLAQAALGYGVGLGGFGFVAHADGVLLSLLEEALNDLGERDSVLRVRVMGRLATELYFTPFRSRRHALSEQAVEVARRLGDPAAEIVALYSRTSATLGPDAPPEQRAEIDRMLSLSQAVGDLDMQFRAHWLRLDAALGAGEVELAEAQVRACRELADELRRPLHAWQAGVFEAMLDLQAGRLEAAREGADAALHLGMRGHRDMALVMYGAQTFTLHWAQGQLAGVLDAARSYADAYPHAPAWRAALAFCLLEVNRPDDARRELELLAGRDFTDIPRDGNFLTAMSLLGLVAARLGDRRRCALVEQLLEPYVDRQVVLAAGAVAHWSAALPLGVLRAAQGDVDGGLRLLTRAQEDHERRGARLYVVATAVEQVRLLLQRGSPEDARAAAALLASALPLAREIGMAQQVERLTGLAAVLAGHDVDAAAAASGSAGAGLEQSDGEAVTLLLTDVAGSTELTERLGERAVHGMLLEHRGTAKAAAQLYGGIALKSLGDGVLCAFPDAASALRCAAWLQSSADDPGGQGLRLRIAVHTGPVLRQGESMYGRSMILAFRLAEHAGPGEVLVSAAARAAADVPDLLFGEAEPLLLKGFSSPELVHRLRRREDAAGA